MFSYSKDLSFDVVCPQLQAANIRQVYRFGADAVAKHTNMPSNVLLARFQEPSRMGRACAGDGVVVADTKIKSLKAPVISLLTLKNDVEFSARDGVGVNIFCMVLSPESQSVGHLRLISRVVRLLKNEDVRAGLLAARSEYDMRTVLNGSEVYMAAA